MAFINYDDFLAAKKMDTFEIRVADNSLTVDQAYDKLVATDVRKQRDTKLAASDWTQMADSPLNADKKLSGHCTEPVYVTYRLQQDSLTMAWPSEPS